MLLGMARFGATALASTEPHILIIITSLCLAVIIILSSLLGIADVITYCACSHDGNKYKNLRAWSCIFFTVILLMIQRYVAEDIQITRVNIPVSKDTKLEGLTIAQISDVHLGPNVGLTKLSLVVEMTNHLRADIIVITGDLIDSSYDNLQHAVKPLAKLKSKLGVYYVTGAHHYNVV